ncbi:MAG TPA: nicotinate phosphoribosyltransferase [Tepidisphaeraceae bacterium]
MLGNRETSLALLTDLYQITMAYGYWRSGLLDRQAAFHMTFRNPPFAGGFTIACGLHDAIRYLHGLKFSESDVQYLAHLRGNDEKPLFDRAFLNYLLKLNFALDVDALPEGTAVFPHEPLLRVTGPILQAQIVETALLNLINFQTLIATKSARVCLAARGEPVLEFGLRRAQGIDGGITASRAAYVGGAHATSNVLAGKLFDIPVKGTHAHSWVMCFENEMEAFIAWADAMPNNCVFLVDTYDSLRGVRHAIEAGKRLRDRGHEMIGIRIDSGDLAYLSIQARKILDAAGFPNAQIFATNNLDEQIITSLKDQGAMIGVWGVGTRLATAYDQPALGGVYKLSAIRDEGEAWQYKIKLSEQTAKVSIPGVLQIRRFMTHNEFIADAIYDTTIGIPDACTIIDPKDNTRRKSIAPHTPHEDLLVPILRGGKLVYELPTIHQSRRRTYDQLTMFHPGVKRFVNPHAYPAGLENQLFDLRTQLILQARGLTEEHRK